MLAFLGRGSAFADEHNSAFFIQNRDLILIDCPATAFQKVKKWKLHKFNNIYVLVTHTHGDHSGGIGTLLQYVWFTNKSEDTEKKRVTVVAPSEQVKQDLSLLLMQIEGCESEWFSLISADELHQDWFISPIATNHVKPLKGKCFGYHLCVHSEDVVYTGDTKTLTPYLPMLKEGTHFYTESAYYPSDERVHLHLPEILPHLIALTEKGVHVYLMHLDNEKEIQKMIQHTQIELAPLWE